VDAPKLFISYSWSNPSHEQWVVDLATQLRESGIDVIFDKWDLREGHDAYAFMEKMVTDPDIKKVAIISDSVYADKADGRSGGVGTETQIISRQVYEQQQQVKFVAIVTEKDEAGKACLPTYYKSRIYIDLSEPDTYADNFEKFLRWVFDKPLYVKPELGKAPIFATEGPAISLGTTALFKRTMDAIKSSKPAASGLLSEYLDLFAQNLERFRISKTDGEFDDAVVQSIQDFLPYRNEFIQLLVTITQYDPSDDSMQKLHRFFESLIPYMDRPENAHQRHEWDYDNFKFIVHELFLYTIAILVKYERFTQASLLMGQHYYLSGNSEHGHNVMASYTVFRKYMRSLQHRNDRLKLERASLRADLLKERHLGTGIDFKYLMQADFVLFLREELVDSDNFGWFPETLLYLGHYRSPFEIFARSVSAQYFNRIKCLLGINVPSDLDELLKSFKDGKRELPRWGFERFSPSSLLGYEQLATKQ